MATPTDQLLTSIKTNAAVGSVLDRVADRLEAAIVHGRAAGQTLSSDIALAGEGLPDGALDLLATSWPAVAAIDARSPWVKLDPNGIPTVWTVGPLVVPSTKQTLEKAAVSTFTVTLKLAAATTLNTYGGYSNVSVQTFDDGPRWTAAVLRAGVARQIDKALCDALIAAGGAGVALAAAVGPMALAWPGPLIIITPVSSPALNECGYDVVIDPLATAAVLVAPAGISFAAQGPAAMANVEPSLLGTGVAAGGILTNITIGAGAATKITSIAAVPAEAAA